MFGCVDAEQGQATGQHRPGGFGEREPGAVGGRGFLLAARQHGGQKGQDGIGDGDEMPGKPVRGAMGGGRGEDAGVVGEGGDDVVSVAGVEGVAGLHGPGLGSEPEATGVTADGPDTGVRIPHPEQRIALPLHEVIGGDPGPVVRRGMEQGPLGGVGPERRGILRRRNGPQIHGFTVLDLTAPALGRDDPHHGIGDDLGPDLVRNPQDDDLPRQGIAVPVGAATRTDLPYDGDGKAGLISQTDVEEPGPGDDDVPDPLGTEETATQNLGNLQRRLPGPAGELERDIGREVPTPPAPRLGHHDPLRHGHAQLPLIDSTTHRVQHGAGELDGGHGTSVGEVGGGYARWFVWGVGVAAGVEGPQPRSATAEGGARDPFCYPP